MNDAIAQRIYAVELVNFFSQQCVLIQQAVIHFPQPEIIDYIALFFIDDACYSVCGTYNIIALQSVGMLDKNETYYFQTEK